MTKQKLIILLSVLGLIIIGLIVWIYLQNQSAPQLVSDSADTLVVENNLPINNQPNISNAPVKTVTDNSTSTEKIETEEYFQWVRVLYTNENDASRRLRNYLDRNRVDQDIVFDQCNLATDSSCSADFKASLAACGLTGEDWSYLPLAFDRSTKRCYRGYNEIVDYLQAELAQVLKKLR
jgi:hypothetical protein